MHKIVFLSVALATTSPANAEGKKDDFCPKCAGLKSVGTTVHFADTPRQAQELAKQHGKLVFLLHVSGNFDKEEFT